MLFDDDEHFDEIKFDDTTLKQVEDLLQKAEPRSTMLRDKTNTAGINVTTVSPPSPTTKPLFSVFVDPVVDKPSVGKASIQIRPAFGDKTKNSIRPAFGDKTNNATRPALEGKTNNSARPAFGDKTNHSTRPALEGKTRPAFGDKTNTRPAFGDKTNTGKTNRSKTISLSKTNKRKTLDASLVHSNPQDPFGIDSTTKKQKAVSMSDRDLANLVFAAMMGDTKAMEQRQDMLLKEYKSSTTTA